MIREIYDKDYVLLSACLTRECGEASKFNVEHAAASVSILTDDSPGSAEVRIWGDEKDERMHLALSCGSGDAGRFGFWAEHVAEAGLAGTDRLAVG
jgi:hypothetical protein